MKLPFPWQNGQWLQISHLFFFFFLGFIYLMFWLWLVFVVALGLSLVAVCGFLIAVGSLVAEEKL